MFRCFSLSRGLTAVEIKFGNCPEHSLDGLDEFSHVWLLFLFDQNTPGSTPKAKVYPPRLGGTPTGLFATRSPHRPNPIGLTLCRLDGVKGSRLSLSGVDLVDGTCILDVKPFIPRYDAPMGDIELPSWAAERDKDDLGVLFSERADKELGDIIAAGIKPSMMSSWDEVKAALVQVLAAGRHAAPPPPLFPPPLPSHLSYLTNIALNLQGKCHE